MRVDRKTIIHFHQRCAAGHAHQTLIQCALAKEMRDASHVSRKMSAQATTAFPPSLDFIRHNHLAYSSIDPYATSADCQPLLNPKFIFPEPRKPDLRPWLPVFTSPWYKFDNPIDNNLVDLPHLQPNLRAEPRTVVCP